MTVNTCSVQGVKAPLHPLWSHFPGQWRPGRRPPGEEGGSRVAYGRRTAAPGLTSGPSSSANQSEPSSQTSSSTLIGVGSASPCDVRDLGPQASSASTAVHFDICPLLERCGLKGRGLLNRRLREAGWRLPSIRSAEFAGSGLLFICIYSFTLRAGPAVFNYREAHRTEVEVHVRNRGLPEIEGRGLTEEGVPGGVSEVHGGVSLFPGGTGLPPPSLSAQGTEWRSAAPGREGSPQSTFAVHVGLDPTSELVLHNVSQSLTVTRRTRRIPLKPGAGSLSPLTRREIQTWERRIASPNTELGKWLHSSPYSQTPK